MRKIAAAIDLPDKTAVRVLDQVLSGTANLCTDLENGRLPFKGTVLADTVSELRYRRRQLMG